VSCANTLRSLPVLAAACLLAGPCPARAEAAAAQAAAAVAPAGEPPRFNVPVAADHPLTFVAYGDTRFSRREGDIVNAYARRALVAKIAEENPAAILIGGDLVYQGSDPQDYEVFRGETAEWVKRKIPVFPALGNHELKGCTRDDALPCLENWWTTFSALSLKPYRWYSVTIGPQILALILDSDSYLRPKSAQRLWMEQQIAAADEHVKFILIVLHYPPVRDPFYPRVLDEKQVARYLARKARSLHAQVVVIGSHVHNYERYYRDGVTYLVSGGGGAKPVPAARMFGELSKLKTSVNYHYLRFVLDGDRLTATMVRFDAAVDSTHDPWSEPDRFEVTAKGE
jgi:acid phosphatase type 7